MIAKYEALSAYDLLGSLPILGAELPSVYLIHEEKRF